MSLDAGKFRATPLPLRPRVGADGRIEALEGHMGRSNPQCAALQRDGARSVLFSGPQGYISPSWVSNRTWAPTWNYAVVQFVVTIAFDETPARLDAHLDDLVGAMERGRPSAWQPSEMGARYETLKRRIVPFEATVVEQRAKFKLGQDERDAVFTEITEALERVRIGCAARLDAGAEPGPLSAARQWGGSCRLRAGIEARYCVGALPNARRNIAVNALGLL